MPPDKLPRCPGYALGGYCTLNIANISTNEWTNNFTFHAETLKNGDQADVSLTSRVARIVAAVAYSGERLPFDTLSPATNASYNLQAFLPLVKCNPNSTSAREFLHARASNESMDTVWAGHPKNSSAVKPDFSYFYDEGPLSYPHSGVYGYIATLNKTSKDHIPTELFAGITKPSMTFLTCTIWNASVSYTVQTMPGSTTQLVVKQVETTFTNELRNGCKKFNSGTCQTYAYFFKELASYIQGLRAAAAHYSSYLIISDGNVENTILIQGVEWVEMVKNMSNIRRETVPLSKIRNTTFAEDIENFALNASLSTMSDPSLWYGLPQFR